MKIKIVFLFLLFLNFGYQSKAQYYFYNGDYYEADFVFEVGGSFGAMNAMTDLGGRKGVGKKGIKDFNLKNTQICGGLFFSVMFKNAIGIRIEGNFGSVKAYDSILKKVAPSTIGRYERFLSFRSPISEIYAVAEIHPFELLVNYSTDRYPPVVSPYLLAGVGYFKFKPQAVLNGNFIDLQPLHLEGQGFAEYPHVKNYKLSQINFPVGIGARYDITPIINVRTEILYRFLTTDYLDDVSGKYIDPQVYSKYLSGNDLTHAILLNDRHIPGAVYSTAHPNGVRGNPKNNDAYITFSIKLGITIGRERR